ncbi:MAG: MATE family efflux transporter [Chitinophagaceae bacterium]|nr:MATE family efflux transporter [Chitinophagaceae bacterium]
MPENRFVRVLKDSLRGEEYDYTQGSIRRAVVLLAIPMILELSLESVFALVDIFFVGKLGKNAIATVGLTESLITIIYSLAIGLSTAATAIVARRVGEKNPESAAHAGAQSILLAMVFVVIISIAGVIFAPELLTLMGASPEVVLEGSVFTRIMLGGSVVIILLFLINGIFRGAGNAAIAMKSLWLASAMNIILCPLLIYGFDLGLKGAAIATTIGRGIGVLYQLYYLMKPSGVMRIRLKHFVPHPEVITSLIKIASPATLQFIIASASWIVMTKFVADTGGTDASAGYQIAFRNIVFFILPAWGLSNAAATLVGQNLGAALPDRAEKSVWLTTQYNIFFMCLVTLFFMLFAGYIIGFYSSDPEVIRYGTRALRIVGSGYIFYGIGMVLIQSLNGAGDTFTPTLVNFICFWLFQIPLAYVLVYKLQWGPEGAFISIPVAETAIAIISYFIFRRGKWKVVKV